MVESAVNLAGKLGVVVVTILVSNSPANYALLFSRLT
jgi:hypothetical protein